MPDAADLVAHARETRVVVIGRAGAVAALECAKVGMAVTLLADDAASAPVDLAGVAVDVDVDGFPADSAVLRGLLDELGIGDRLGPIAAAASWYAGAPGAAAGDAIPLPAGAILGIPANPWDPAARRLIGWRGTWRAYLDSVRPPLTIGRERNLDALVRSRMGDRVAERLVAPVTRARFGLEPGDVDVEVAAPGLNTALTRTGSLSGAVAALGGTPGPPALALDEPEAWDAALADRLRDLDVEVLAGRRATALARTNAGWRVTLDAAADAGDGAGDGAGTAATPPAALEADVVVVAVAEESAARALLEGIVDLPAPAAEAPRDVVLLRVRGADLGRGEVIPVSGEVHRIVDATTVLPSLAARVAAGERILHVTLAGSDADDGAVIDAACAAASAALAAALRPEDVVDARRVRLPGTIPRVRAGAEADAAAVHDAVAAVPGLALTGPWLSGGARADAVADAVAEAARVRRDVLWGGADGP